ncbi:MAG TPA: Jag N-terminal domain-containing protein, partial [Clostridia bacterium]|nr:Jag N-terminal domain-containing protein [Clostridia bacterium]
MRSIEVEAKTVEEAIFKGLAQLNLSIDQAKIDILEEGSKGLFNILGSKQAKVRITEKARSFDNPEDFLRELFAHMGVNINIETEELGDTLQINLSGDRIGTVIGHRGETLDAIQYLTGL